MKTMPDPRSTYSSQARRLRSNAHMAVWPGTFLAVLTTAAFLAPGPVTTFHRALATLAVGVLAVAAGLFFMSSRTEARYLDRCLEVTGPVDDQAAGEVAADADGGTVFPKPRRAADQPAVDEPERVGGKAWARTAA